MAETLIGKEFFGSYLRKEFYFTQNVIGEDFYSRIKKFNQGLLQEKKLDILLNTDADEFARTGCLPVTFAVGINYLLDKLFFSNLSAELNIGDLLELAILAHSSQNPAIDSRTGNWYYSFLLDVSRRLGFSGQVVTKFESTEALAEFIEKGAICLVSLDNQVVPEITLKGFNVTKKLRGGRHLFLLHGWEKSSKNFLCSDVFNPIPNLASGLNFLTPSKILDNYLVTEKMPNFSTRALILARGPMLGCERKIDNPFLVSRPDLSLVQFLIWARDQEAQTENPL